jgi:Skp family chaperone for outer membrane proteins
MLSWKLTGGLAALVAAGVLAAQLPGNAQKKNDKAANSGVGYVDLAAVTEQIRKTPTWQTMTKKFDDQKGVFAKEIETLTKTRYLTKQERDELESLRAKPKPTDAEKARIDELEKRSDAVDREAQTLAGVEKPTDVQSKRIGELAEMRKAALAGLQDETEKRSQQLREFEAQVLEDMQKQVLEKVSQVAEGKGVTMVIDRQAILYGGQDLTQDVVKKLGGGGK